MTPRVPRLPLAHALVNALDRGEGVEPELVVELAAAQVIDDGNLDTRVVRPSTVPRVVRSFALDKSGGGDFFKKCGTYASSIHGRTLVARGAFETGDG